MLTMLRSSRIGKQAARLFGRLSLAHKFMLASLLILVSSMVGIGWWVGQEIADGVVHRVAATTALYVDSFISPQLQELGQGDTLALEHRQVLDKLLEDTQLGQHIVAFKVWDAQGRILYSSDPAMIGQTFPVQGGLARAWHGEVAARISDLDDDENVAERTRQSRALEMYSPVRLDGTNRIIAVAEFYQSITDLQGEIEDAQRRSWLVVGVATVGIYLLLAGLVQQASNTIARQQTELSDKVAQLTQLLEQNDVLHERVRRAAARTTALNERFLRRIGAELHDGPAQYLGLALLRLDTIPVPSSVSHGNGHGPGNDHGSISIQYTDHVQQDQPATELQTIQDSLRRALHEVRAISSGLALPELQTLDMAGVVTRVVRAHERQSGTKVHLDLGQLPDQAPLPVKITLYRVIQEALQNAARHAGGTGQQVRVHASDGHLEIAVADQGPGFNASDGQAASDSEEHLGVIGMRERVESLGGTFRVVSTSGQGTTVMARIPLEEQEELHE